MKAPPAYSSTPPIISFSTHIHTTLNRARGPRAGATGPAHTYTHSFAYAPSLQDQPTVTVSPITRILCGHVFSSTSTPLRDARIVKGSHGNVLYVPIRKTTRSGEKESDRVLLLLSYTTYSCVVSKFVLLPLCCYCCLGDGGGGGSSRQSGVGREEESLKK